MSKTVRWLLAPTSVLILGACLLIPARLAAEEAPATEQDASKGTATEQAPKAEATKSADSSPIKEKGKPARKKRTGRPLQPGSTAPPQNLKLVGDHWTPYDPPKPESFPPEATLHIIVPGDTLWDLADLAFGNPYLWPQIWNENRYILDSHWIYPGDPLLVPARPTVVSEVVPQAQEGAPPAPAATPAQPQEQPPQEPLTAEAPAPAPVTTPRPPAEAHRPRAVPKITPLAGESDIRCSGFIASKDDNADYFIANQEDENKVGLSEGDVIYLNRGKENGHVDPGTQYSIIVREGEVRHPITNRKLGYYYKRLGTVTLLAAQDRTAIAAISMACDDIRTGYDLVPLRVVPEPMKPAPPFGRLQVLQEGKAEGYIVHTEDNLVRTSAGAIVDIDLGYDDGVKAGDYLTIYLANQPYDKYRKMNYDYRLGNRRFQTPPQRIDRRNEYPPKIIGQMVVLATERHTATAKIIQSLREIELGNQVQLQ